VITVDGEGLGLVAINELHHFTVWLDNNSADHLNITIKGDLMSLKPFKKIQFL
jgi:hypothetical protein